jgi:hypothetical protein
VARSPRSDSGRPSSSHRRRPFPSATHGLRSLRPSGLEPPRGNLPTRPSTLRVYQFRHGRRGGEYSPRGCHRLAGPPPTAALASVHARRYSANTCSFQAPVHPNREPSRHGSDQAPAGDIRLHPQVLGQVRLSADGARHRQGGRLASSSTVHAHLANLEKIGLLRRDPSKPRAIELLDRAEARGERARDRAPERPAAAGLGGRGQPMLAEENIEDYVSVPEIAGGGDGEYLLRIRGDSMKDAGILEGDSWSCTPRTPRRTATSWWRCWARRRPSSASSANRPHSPAAGERDDGADPQQGGQGARTRGGVAQERLNRAPRRFRAAAAHAFTARPSRARLDGAGQAAAEARGLRGKSGHHRAGWSRSTRGNPRESATETNRRCPPSHVNGGQARVKWCGKSAPASR